MYSEKKENKKKNIKESDDILYINDFTLEKFANSGDSSDLYLAINKHILMINIF